MSAPDLAVIGYLSLDEIACPAGRFHDVPGGGAYYAAAAAAVTGARVMLVARAGSDFPEAALDALRGLGICLDEVARDAGPSRRSRLQDPDGLGRVLPHHAEAAWWQATRRLAPALPRRETPVRMFTAMPADVLARQLDASALCTHRIADTSTGYARGETDLLLAQISRLSCFAPSREETRILFPQLDDDAALRELSRCVPLALQKRGADGVALRRGDMMRIEPTRASEVVETTGAGDSFVGAVAAGLALGLDDAELLRRGALTAALTVSGIGASRLIGGGAAAILDLGRSSLAVTGTEREKSYGRRPA